MTGRSTVFFTCLMTSRFMLEREVRSRSSRMLVMDFNHQHMYLGHTLHFLLYVTILTSEKMPNKDY